MPKLKLDLDAVQVETMPVAPPEPSQTYWLGSASTNCKTCLLTCNHCTI